MQTSEAAVTDRVAAGPIDLGARRATRQPTIAASTAASPIATSPIQPSPLRSGGVVMGGRGCDPVGVPNAIFRGVAVGAAVTV